MKTSIFYLALTLAVCVVLGATIGFLIAKPASFSDHRYGTVPAHECVVEGGYRCGMFVDETAGVFEIGKYSKTARDVVTGVVDGGRLTWGKEPISPTRLTETQIDAVFASRSDLLNKARLDLAETGAQVGFATWSVVTVALAAYVLVTLIRDHFRPVTQSVGRSAYSLGRSVQSAGRSIGETAALKAEVRKSELLARKAVAEAKLKRPNPDVHQHELQLRRKIRT